MKNIFVGLYAVLLVGCAAVEKTAFNRAAHQNIRSITIIEPKPSTGFGVQVLNHPALGFGLIGASLYAAEMTSKSGTLDAAMKPFAWSVTDTLTEQLARMLTEKGYVVKRLKVERDLALIKDYPSLKADNQSNDALASDAYLDLATRDPLYVANGPTADYLPSVVVTVRLVDSKDFTLLYRDDFMYGYAYKIGALEPVLIPAEAKYRYTNMDALTKEPKETFEGIREGIPKLVARIASDLAKQ